MAVHCQFSHDKDKVVTVDCLMIELQFDGKKPPPRGGFPIYYVLSSRAVCNRTPFEENGTNPSRGVLLHKALDQGT